jgi:hypothetical protein
MIKTDVSYNCVPAIRSLIEDFLSKKINGDQLHKNFNKIRLSFIKDQRNIIESYAINQEEYINNKSKYFDIYRSEYPIHSKIDDFIGDMFTEIYYQSTDDRVRAELQATASEGMHYLSDEELRDVVRKLYERAAQEGLWQDSGPKEQGR